MTFDCFGTLIDWRHGIGTTGELLFPGRGQDFLDAYIALEAEVESEGSFKRYRAVLAETTRRAAKRLSLDLKPDDATALVSTIPHWPPFADVGPALGELRREGWKFALLTNCDRDIIALTQRRLPAAFDAVVTAEDVSAYKPNHAHFRLFQSTFGSSAEFWVHVAQSYFHDIKPTHELGITRVWVNRQGEKDDPSMADAVIGGLAELPAALSSIAHV
ncbi:MAG TPA: HAD family hydrolase [Candidatus Dormibacteraeota bacterium]|nr:HAD family hydrolase [Candidatus Dormibacteraeota bacterium]HEX2679907.1 HAD family hydrolase [Candidatus Dormibacteraeota bacterium]